MTTSHLDSPIVKHNKQLQEQIYDLLHSHIMCQDPGAQLESERELASRFDVSRPTVRAALKRLEEGGFVSRRQGGGTFVTEQVKRKLAELLYYHGAYGLASDGCYGQCLEAMRTTVEGYGHRLAVVGTDNPRQVPGPDYSLVAQEDETAAIVTLGIMNHAYIAGLAKFKRPVVTVDYDGGGTGVDAVAFDSFGAGRQMAGHLIELGHSRIAFIGRHRGINDLGEYRGEPDSMKTGAGIEFTLKEKGLPLRDEFSCEADMNVPDEVQSLAHRLLSLENPPTAIITSSAPQALAVIQTARAAGLTVPEKLSVACYEGGDEVGARISGVTVDMQEMGEVAGRTVAARLDDPAQPKVLVNIPGRLVLQGTTGSLS